MIRTLMIMEQIKNLFFIVFFQFNEGSYLSVMDGISLVQTGLHFMENMYSKESKIRQKSKFCQI